MSYKHQLIDLPARVIHETDKARLLDFGTGEHIWLPKTVHTYDNFFKTVTMYETLAFDKGLI